MLTAPEAKAVAAAGPPTPPGSPIATTQLASSGDDRASHSHRNRGAGHASGTTSGSPLVILVVSAGLQVAFANSEPI